MANLKKVLAGSLSLCLAASMFTACGSSDSSSTPDAKYLSSLDLNSVFQQ